MGKSCQHYWVSRLLRELKSPEAELRYEAALASGEIGSAETVNTLIELSADADDEVRQAAIGALGKIGSDLAQRYLEKLSRHDNEIVAEAAKEALEEQLTQSQGLFSGDILPG